MQRAVPLLDNSLDNLYTNNWSDHLPREKMKTQKIAPLTKFLLPLSPGIQTIVIGLRHLIQSNFPEVAEQVDLPANILAYGYGAEHTSLICALTPYSDHVKLMFSMGSQISDPAGILKGGGKNTRHVEISSMAEIKRPALRSLLRSAQQLMEERIDGKQLAAT